jgi:hypothetical protein
LTSEAHDELKSATPFKAWPYFLSGNHRIAAWHAAEVLDDSPH